MRTNCFLCCVLFALASASSCSDRTALTMIVGTYTEDGASRGMYSYRFDQNKAVLIDGEKNLFGEAPGAVGMVEMPNPSYLTLSSDCSMVYAVNETADSSASACAVRLNPQSGEMQLIGSQPTDGMDPCYISTNGKLVMTANYSSGNVTGFPIGGDGSLLPHHLLFDTGAGGPDTARQQFPHAHCALFDASGTRLYVSEFSADLVTEYDLDSGTGKSISLPSDFGPRHIILNAGESRAYVLGELSGSVAVIDTRDGRVLQTVCADTVHARGSADIHLSPDGQYLYASNRLQNDGIAIFSVGNDGTLTHIGYQNTGIHPRNFNITPNGRFLLAACRDSNCIQVFRRNRRTGLLTDTGRRITIDKPVCIVFAH